MKNLKKNLRVFFAVILTIVLVWVLFSQINPFDIILLLKQMPLHFIAISFVLYIFGHLGRTLRFYRLLNWKKSFYELFCIVCVHNLFINTLPARTGELSYFYMTKKRGIPLTKGGSILLISRIFDMISIAIILLFSVFFAKSLPLFFTKLSWVISIGLIFCIVLLLFFIYFDRFVLSFITKIFSLFRIRESKMAHWVIDKSKEVLESFKMLKSKKYFFEQLFYSLFIWSVRFILFYLITISLGIVIGFWVCIIGLILPILSAFLPIQGFGGFGTIEGTWVVSFMLLGIAKEAAILSGFAFHIVFLIFTILAGLFGAIVLFLSKN